MMSMAIASSRKHPLAQCEVCPLRARRHCPSQTPTGEAAAAVVSRSPAYGDTLHGRPFSGPSGEVLDHLLQSNGTSRKEVLVTNVVLCSPPEGKVPPAAIEACAPRLKAELEGIDLVVAAGSEAVNSLLGRGSIDSYRGYRVKRGRHTIVATNNPALVLRDDSTFPNLVKDFKRAFNPIPEPTMPKVVLLSTVEDARTGLVKLAASEDELVSFDLETRGGLTHKATIVCFQWSTNGKESFVVAEPASTDSTVLKYLKHIMELKHNNVPNTPYVEMEIRDGLIAKIDPEDEERVRQHKWSPFVSGRETYARNTTKDDHGHWLLHQFILREREIGIDHRNHDPLDCRKVNLRRATQAQNTRNARKMRDTENTYKGACWSAASKKNPYASYIDIGGKRKHLGYYRTDEEAALVYDIAAYEADPEFALLNFKPKRWLGHNYIFDTKILRHSYGIQARVDHDTLLLSYACDERPAVHSLDYLLMEELGWPHYEPKAVGVFKRTGLLVSDATCKHLRKTTTGAADYDLEYRKIENRNYLALYRYAGYDVAGTYALFDLLEARAKEQGVYVRPYKETLVAAEETLHSMAVTGMPYDYHRAAEILEKVVAPELATIRTDLAALCGKELLNPASSQQMATVYYDDYGVKHEMQQRPDAARSIDASARKEILEGRFSFKGEMAAMLKNGQYVSVPHVDAQKTRNLIQRIAEHHDRFQKLNKQANTYLTSLIERAEDDSENKIYTDLIRHGTTTGRLASRNPNLQNITRTKEGLPDIRGLFYASAGYVLVQADYSQAELRTIACLSGDKLLGGYYERGEDLHSATASRFYGEGFSIEQRARSKNMNFGVFYGQSAATFQEKHGIPEREAESYIKWVWDTFTTVGEWEESIRQLVHKQSYVESPFGHRRRFYLITQENKNAIYREAINFLPQNISANLTLHACIRIRAAIDPRKANLCLTVHDSILSQVVETYVEEYSTICQQVMESQASVSLGWDLPFVADLGVGTTWGSAK